VILVGVCVEILLLTGGSSAKNDKYQTNKQRCGQAVDAASFGHRWFSIIVRFGFIWISA
jgi:hypothetical protein